MKFISSTAEEIERLNEWVKSRNFDQPYGSKLHLVRIIVNGQHLYLELSATDPRFFNKVADEAIANYFFFFGKNTVRNELSELFTHEELPNRFVA